jgi:hypothetical protein
MESSDRGEKERMYGQIDITEGNIEWEGGEGSVAVSLACRSLHASSQDRRDLVIGQHSVPVVALLPHVSTSVGGEDRKRKRRGQ